MSKKHYKSLDISTSGDSNKILFYTKNTLGNTTNIGTNLIASPQSLYKKIFFDLNTPGITPKIHKIVSDSLNTRNYIDYQNYKIEEISKGSSAANYILSHVFKDSFFSYGENNEKIFNYQERVFGLVDIHKITNFYSFQSDNDINNFYSSFDKNIPSNTKYIYYIPQSKLKESNIDTKINLLPEYVKISIPKIFGINEEYREFIDKLLATLKTKFFVSSLSEYHYLSKVIFFNYLYTVNKNKYANILDNDNKPISKQIKFFDIINDSSSIDYETLLEQLKIETIENEISPSAKETKSFSVIKGLIDERFQTFDELQKIIDKTDSFFLPIMYKIEKFNKFMIPVQEIYVPIENLNEDTVYIDNQILPKDVYTYKVSLINVSFGFSSKIQVDQTPNVYFIDNVASVILPIISENTYFQDIATEKNIYPVIPEASFYSLIGDHNRIKIFLSNKIARGKVIDIYGNNLELIDQTEDSNFSSNYYTSTEVYRLETKPDSYLNFANSKIASLDKQNTSFFDSIENNKKYYYIFRNYNGKSYSNPSEIYEIELKNVDGNIIPNFSSYMPQKDEEDMFFLREKLSFKKRVKLAPSSYQQNLDNKDSQYVEKTQKSFSNVRDSDYFFNNVVYGNVDSIYNVNLPIIQNDNGEYVPARETEEADKNPVRYKIRIISKKTGKMVDINLQYKYIVSNLLKNR